MEREGIRRGAAPSSAGEDGGGKHVFAIQRELGLGLVPGPVSYLCPGPDPRPALLLCTEDWVVDLTLLWGQKDRAEGPDSGGESRWAASDFPHGSP